MRKTDIMQLRTADWDQLERDVVTRIRMLRAIVEKIDVNPLSDKVAQDLFLPAVTLLGEFCTMIEIDGEDKPDTSTKTTTKKKK